MSLVIEDGLAKSVFGMTDAIAAMRNAYGAFSRGEILESSRVNVLYPKAFLRLMAAAWPSRKLAGYKVLHRANGHAGATYHLYEMETASLVAMIDAGHLTAVRTGACGGLAADLMAAPDAEVLGVIGTGNEARAQVEAICAVRPIRRLQAFGRDPQRRETFCREMADRFGLEAAAAPDGPSALKGAQIIAVATNTGAAGPAFFGDWIGDHPVHINSIGSTLPIQRELDERVWSRSHRHRRQAGA
jgi:alanine dehydrogenase